MKEAAILTKYYKNYNYGGMLQGYALHKVITDMGLECDIVSYDVTKNQNPVYGSLLQQCKQYGPAAFIQKVSEKVVGKFGFSIRETITERKARFDSFMEETGADTRLYDDSNLKELNSEYASFISGSDQIWNPNAVRKLYLQDFVADDKKKISYAASIGRGSLSEDEAAVLIPSIKSFDYLSVREKTAEALLKKYMDNEIYTVIDPTLLLPEEDWGRVSAPRLWKEKYAVVYFFSDSLKVRKKASDFCENRGLDLLFIPYAKQEFNFNDGKGPGSRLNDVGPKEFVSAIKYSDFVFTDSFHGTVFSIIHKKQFVVFERNKAGHVSMNSRLYDLLALFGLSDRLVNINDFEKVSQLGEIDYDSVFQKLGEQKELSLSFLRMALTGEEHD